MNPRLVGVVIGSGGILMLSLVSVWMFQKPIPLKLPESIPIVLGFSTGFSVEQTIDHLSSKYSVKKEDFVVEVIQNERLFLKKEPLRHMLTVNKPFVPGISSSKINFYFIRGRLMEVQFIPRLNADECECLLGKGYGSFIPPWGILEQMGRNFYSGDCGGEDSVLLIDYAWGSGVRSALLWKAFFKLR